MTTSYTLYYVKHGHCSLNNSIADIFRLFLIKVDWTNMARVQIQDWDNINFFWKQSLFQYCKWRDLKWVFPTSAWTSRIMTCLFFGLLYRLGIWKKSKTVRTLICPYKGHLSGPEITKMVFAQCTQLLGRFSEIISQLRQDNRMSTLFLLRRIS